MHSVTKVRILIEVMFDLNSHMCSDIAEKMMIMKDTYFLCYFHIDESLKPVSLLKIWLFLNAYFHNNHLGWPVDLLNLNMTHITIRV